MTAVKVELTREQHRFVATPSPYPCFCGGFGAGKTEAGIIRAIVRKLALPDHDYAQYLPTYDLVRRTWMPRLEQKLDELKIRHKPNYSDNFIRVLGRGMILFRTMDNPARIISYEVADSGADELDTLKTEDAREIWRRILSRNRQKKPGGEMNTASVTTTPEGFRFVYETWGKTPQPGYELIRAPTISNARNLPPGYIESLRKMYPANLLQAYLEGQFVNLATGTICHEFDRDLNGTTETMRPGETLHIGMDFNVGHMAAAIYVLRNDAPVAVGELVDRYDTPATAGEIKREFKDKGHPIIIYPDASGQARKSVRASESDIAVLKDHGFQVFVNSRNPAVKDRILATNQQIHKEGVRRLRVNPDACPHLVEAFEKQAYDLSGEPEKSNPLNHIFDAGTYPIAYRYPVEKRVAIVTPLRL